MIERQPIIELDNIVIVKKDSAPPMSWPLGEIMKVFDGNGKIGQVAQLQTAKDFHIRPVSELVLLMTEDKSQTGFKKDKKECIDKYKITN